MAEDGTECDKVGLKRQFAQVVGVVAAFGGWRALVSTEQRSGGGEKRDETQNQQIRSVNAKLPGEATRGDTGRYGAMQRGGDGE